MNNGLVEEAALELAARAARQRLPSRIGRESLLQVVVAEANQLAGAVGHKGYQSHRATARPRCGSPRAGQGGGRYPGGSPTLAAAVEVDNCLSRVVVEVLRPQSLLERFGGEVSGEGLGLRSTCKQA